jgi:hypothetical protein
MLLLLLLRASSRHQVLLALGSSRGSGAACRYTKGEAGEGKGRHLRRQVQKANTVDMSAKELDGARDRGSTHSLSRYALRMQHLHTRLKTRRSSENCCTHHAFCVPMLSPLPLPPACGRPTTVAMPSACSCPLAWHTGQQRLLFAACTTGAQNMQLSVSAQVMPSIPTGSQWAWPMHLMRGGLAAFLCM